MLPMSCILVSFIEMAHPFVVMETQFSITFMDMLMNFVVGFIEGHCSLLGFHRYAIVRCVLLQPLISTEVLGLIALSKD